MLWRSFSKFCSWDLQLEIFMLFGELPFQRIFVLRTSVLSFYFGNLSYTIKNLLLVYLKFIYFWRTSISKNFHGGTSVLMGLMGNLLQGKFWRTSFGIVRLFWETFGSGNLIVKELPCRRKYHFKPWRWLSDNPYQWAFPWSSQRFQDNL